MDPISYILKKKGFKELNPVQKKAIQTGLLDGKSMVISSPTGSGKTLIAEIAAINTIWKGKKVVYTCPLRALAAEQYENFSKLHNSVALSIGDYDSADPFLKNYDWICTTYEKLDSLIRHRAPWLSQVGLLIVDEIHEIDSSRGPTLEVLITKMKKLSNLQILALSATIPNADEIANWIGGEMVISDYRPVPLHEGIAFDGKKIFIDHEEMIKSKEKNVVERLVDECLRDGGQVLVFANTRRNAESWAKKLSNISKKYTPPLNDLSEKVLHVLSNPTKQCKLLAQLVQKGCAFHHAGLAYGQRKAIEGAFREGKLLVIVATPTLAAGVNLPARRIIITTPYFYEMGLSRRISVREYKQRCGRAGRPQYDRFGEAFLIARNEWDVEEFMEKYVKGKPEPIESKLGYIPALRSHVLSIICDFTSDREKIVQFFMDTFYGYQYGSDIFLKSMIEKIINDLAEWGFVKKNGKVDATDLGRRVNALYIDPYSAHKIISSLLKNKGDEMGYLYMICDTEELSPWLPVSKKDDILYDSAYHIKFLRPVSELLLDYHFLAKLKTAMMLNDWINEKSEEEILELYNIPPGILYSYIERAEWMCYASIELAKLLGVDASKLLILRRRIKKGVKEELLPLVSVKGIGRVRGRLLFNAGFRKPSDLLKNEKKVLSILGEGIGKKVLEEIRKKGL